MTAPAARTARGAGLRDFALAGAGAGCFGLTILFNTVAARDDIGPVTALSLRFAIAGVALLALLHGLRRSPWPPRGERAAVAVLGVVLYAVEATFFFAALERGSAAAVALLFYSYPAVVALADVALGAHRPDGRVFVALACAVGGGALVAVGGGEVAITAGGVLCVAGSVFTFSTYVLASDRLLHHTEPLVVACWSALGSAVSIGVVGALAGSWRAPSGSAVAAIVANGLATAAAFTLFFVVLGRIGPTRTAIVMTLEAVFGVALTAWFLDEPVEAIVVAGGAVILVGAVLAATAGRRRVEAVESATSP